MNPLNAIVLKHEGLKLKPYKDTRGFTTIGVGRNLDVCGISSEEAYTMLDNDLTRCQLELISFSWYGCMDEIRKGVIIELVFNVGLSKALQFTKMIAALKILDYPTASKELLNSDWAVQVGRDRSNNMASRLLLGRYL